MDITSERGRQSVIGGSIESRIEKIRSSATKSQKKLIEYLSSTNYEKIIYLSDLLEAGRDFPHVDRLRACFARDLNECMYRALKHQRKYLKKQGGPIDPLTARAYEYYSQWMKRGDKTTKGETK